MYTGLVCYLNRLAVCVLCSYNTSYKVLGFKLDDWAANSLIGPRA